MHPSKPALGESPKRRRLSRWALLNAWKLAGSTALVTFVGVFLAVTLSLILRPARTYFFPLLSDVDKHHPEAAILRCVIIAATLLFFATTTASIIHCHTLRLFSKDRAMGHTHGHSDEATDALADEADIMESVGTNALPLSPMRRRSHRMTTKRTVLTCILLIIMLAPLLQYPHLTAPISSGLRQINFTNVLYNFAFYMLVVTWAAAMCFLIWYFLKLQTMPDRPHSLTSTPHSAHTDVTIKADAPTPTQQQQTLRQNFTHRLSAFGSWVVVILRPVCLTGQAVCIIKIFGLWLALDTFSISNIRLVKIALLAALAFTEYTTAFFFSFFMAILALDMRSKATPSPDLIQT